MRLTNKNQILEGFVGYDVIKKLSDLEDIEEELGIDLVTLFKALKNGIWSKHYAYLGEEPHLIKVQLHYGYDNNWWLDGGFGEGHYFKDYGKTWALTKEELVSEEKEMIERGLLTNKPQF